MTRSLIDSADMLFLMLFVLGIEILVSATLLWVAEKGDLNEDLGYYVRPGGLQRGGT